jgi:hypothetical protein
LDEHKQIVTFAWKDYADGARLKTMTLGVREFVRRFCLHLLPERFVKIRHFGFLSNRQRQTRVIQVRALLQPRTPTESAPNDAQPKIAADASATVPGRVCPYCGSDRLWLMEIVPAIRLPYTTLPTIDSS